MLLSGELLTPRGFLAIYRGGNRVGGHFFGCAFLFFSVERSRGSQPKNSWRCGITNAGCWGNPAFGCFSSPSFVAGASEGAFTFWRCESYSVEFGGESARGRGFAAAPFAAGMIAARLAWGLFLRTAASVAFACRVMPSRRSGEPLCYRLRLRWAWRFFAFFGGGVACAALWPSIQTTRWIGCVLMRPLSSFLLSGGGHSEGFASRHG